MLKDRILWFKKIYFPGLISLICLPLFCLTKIIYPRYFEKQTAIHIAWLNSEEVNRDIHKSFRLQSSRKLEDDSLTSEKINNATVFAKLRQKIAHYESTDDTLSAYRITFANKSKYEDVVNVLDILQTNQKKSLAYMWLNNKIEVFKINPLPEKKSAGNLDHDMIFCGTSSVSQSYVEPVPFFSKENFVDMVGSTKDFVVKFWASLIFLLLMVASAIASKKKFINNLH
jgi:hypothetical protein